MSSNLPAVQSWLQSDKLKKQVAQALPKHLTADRFMRILFTTMQKTPKLMNCTTESLFNALITCSQLGIEPDGRRAHLIPYGNQCQLIIDYKGLVELVLRSGEASTIHADTICENDVFEYNMGEIVKHKIDFRRDRGDCYAVYAVVTLKDGNKKAEVMNRADIEKIRARSKASNSGPWVTDWSEMAKKTVFRRLSKWLPLSPEIKQKIAADDDQYDENDVTGASQNSEMVQGIMDSINPRAQAKAEESEDTEDVAEAEVVDETQEEESEPEKKPAKKSTKKQEKEEEAKDDEPETAETVDEGTGEVSGAKDRPATEEEVEYLTKNSKYLSKEQQRELSEQMTAQEPTMSLVEYWKGEITKAYEKKKSGK